MTSRELPADQLELVASLIAHVPVGVLAADEQLRCAYVNQRLSTLAGRPSAALCDDGLARSLEPADRRRLRQACQRAIADRAETVEAVELPTPDGRDPHVEVRLSPLTAADGVVRGVVGVVQEVAAPPEPADTRLAPTIGYVAQLE